MSTLDLIRTLRRTLNGVRDAHDEGAVAELARALICELNVNLREVSPNPSAGEFMRGDDVARAERDEIGEGGMAVFA